MNTADSVTLRALGADGDEVDATFLLGTGIGLMTETAHTSVLEPDNVEITAQLRGKIGMLLNPPSSDTPLPSSAQYDDW